MAATPTSVQKSDEEWRAILSPEQFRILRQKGTELRGTGEYDKFFDEGVYNCTSCGTLLYKSTTKFDSGCGWPAFFEVSQVLLAALQIQMEGGLKLHALPVGDTWVMFLEERDIQHQQMSDTVSIASPSSSFLQILLLDCG